MFGKLEMTNLHVSIDGQPILKGVNLTVEPGELHALMGPNGSGKSTLAMTLMGHPRYKITGGEIRLNGQVINAWTPEKRAQAGMFLSFQYPSEVSGVPFAQFLRTAFHAARQPKQPVPFATFQERLTTGASAVKFGDALLERSVNEGFSGGEKKRAEVFQLRVLEPELAILDEPDSGLDIDALKTVASALQQYRNAQRGFLVVTHYQRILQYLKPDRVHVFMDGRVVRSGGPELAVQLEAQGYEPLMRERV